MASRASLDGSRGFSSGKDVSDRRTGGALRGEGAALLQHGQKLYQQGNFKAATEAFTEVFLVLVCIHGNMEAEIWFIGIERQRCRRAHRSGQSICCA